MAFAPQTLKSFPPRDPSISRSSSMASLPHIFWLTPGLRATAPSSEMPSLRARTKVPAPTPYSLTVRRPHWYTCLLSVSATRMLLAEQGSAATSVPWCPRSVFLNGWWCIYPHSSKTKSTDAGKGLGDIHAAASPSAKHPGPLKHPPHPLSMVAGGSTQDLEAASAHGKQIKVTK